MRHPLRRAHAGASRDPWRFRGPRPAAFRSLLTPADTCAGRYPWTNATGMHTGNVKSLDPSLRWGRRNQVLCFHARDDLTRCCTLR